MLKHTDIDLLELPTQRNRKTLPVITEDEITQAREYGIINPVVAIPKRIGKGFIIIGGEKSWLLAQRAMIHRVPVYIREDITEEEIRELHKGSDRRNPITEARELKRKLEAMPKPKKAVLARMKGMTRTALSHRLRLLELSDEVQELLETGDILEGHARPLIGLDWVTQRRIAKKTVEKKLSVRQIKELVRKAKGLPEKANQEVRQTRGALKNQDEKSQDIVRLENEISEILGSRVLLEDGKMVVDYGGNLDILDGILEKLGYQSY